MHIKYKSHISRRGYMAFLCLLVNIYVITKSISYTNNNYMIYLGSVLKSV